MYAQKILTEVRRAIVGKDQTLLWVLAAIVIGGGVLGIPGMLLGVPLAAAFYKLLRERVVRKEAQEQAAREEAEGPEQITFEE